MRPRILEIDQLTPVETPNDFTEPSLQSAFANNDRILQRIDDDGTYEKDLRCTTSLAAFSMNNQPSHHFLILRFTESQESSRGSTKIQRFSWTNQEYSEKIRERCDLSLAELRATRQLQRQHGQMLNRQTPRRGDVASSPTAPSKSPRQSRSYPLGG